MHDHLVWRDFKKVVFFKAIIRQREQEKELRGVLTNLRTYNAKPSQGKWLQQL